MRYFDRIANVGVESLCLDTRGFHGMKRNGMNTVEDVVNEWSKLYALRQIGKRTVKIIKNSLLSMYYDTLDTEEKQQFWRDAFGQ